MVEVDDETMVQDDETDDVEDEEDEQDELYD